jgi:O-antigen ligase
VLSFLLLPILALIPGALLSSFQFSYGLANELTNQVLCVILAFFLYSVIQIRSSAGYWKVLWIFVPTIYFVCLIAFIEKLGFAPLVNIPLNPFEASSLSLPWEYQGITSRVESTFGNINYFASFLIQLLPITLALFLITKLQDNANGGGNQLFRIAAGVSVVCVLLALFFTQTRSAIFAAILSIMFFVLLLVKIGFVSKKLVVQLGAGSTVLITAIIVIALAFDSDRFSLLLNKETWWPRTIPWQTAWSSFKSAPFFGYGIGSSYQLFFEFVSSDSRLFSANRSYNHVHNEILQILQEGGIAGLVVYLIFWTIPFWLGMKYVLNNKKVVELRILISALFCGLMAYHIHGLFSVAPRMISSRLIAYSLLAIMLAVLLKSPADGFKSNFIKTKKSFVALVLTLSITAITSYLIPFLQGQFQYVNALTHPDRYSRLTQLTYEYDDIYILEAAAKEAFEINDAEQLLIFTRKSADIFPYYRQMEIYRAYGLFWKGNTEAAYQVAAEYQARDSYSSLTNSLLLSIALERSSEKDALIQLKKIIEYQACISQLLECNTLNINVLMGHFAMPFQVIDKGEKWNVLIDHAFWGELRDLKVNMIAGGENNAEATSTIIGLLSAGHFFKPKPVGIPLNNLDYENLALYLKFLNQGLESNEQALVLADELELVMELESFLQSRMFLIGLSNTLRNAIN